LKVRFTDFEIFHVSGGKQDGGQGGGGSQRGGRSGSAGTADPTIATEEQGEGFTLALLSRIYLAFFETGTAQTS
jgi:hypothetical protein